MGIEARLAAIEEMQSRILRLLVKGEAPSAGTMTLKEAAAYTGYSPDHFRRLAVEQRIIPFCRPSGQQKGKLLFRKSDLDKFLDSSKKGEKEVKQPGRKRKSKDIRLW
jgi:excisionase family DNA binding protein